MRALEEDESEGNDRGQATAEGGEAVELKAGRQGVEDSPAAYAAVEEETMSVISLEEEPSQQASVSQRAPLWAWCALVVAVLACSSGGVWFALLNDVPAMLRASWRLMITALLQLPGFISDYSKANSVLRIRYRKAYHWLFLSGLALAVHFCAWSLSLDMTSLSHSLLFVCTTPILIVAVHGMAFLCCRRYIPNRFKEPPTWIECIGTLVGFSAAVALAQEAAVSGSSAQERNPTLQGDLVATLGAAAMGIYLSLGASVRLWLPLWLYVFPVTLTAGVTSGAASLIMENTTFTGLESNSLLGMFGDGRRFGLVFGAALTSGILGHTLVNLSLVYISPLIVSLLLLFEPLIGSLMGYLVGVQGAPSLVTYLAGIPLMLAAGIVSMGGRDGDIFRKVQPRCCVRSPKIADQHEPITV